MKHYVIFFFIVTIVMALTPIKVSAQEPSKNVCVGWYESPFNTMDENGRRSG